MTPAVRQIIFGAYDPDARDYFRRIEAVGSIDSNSRKSVSRFFKAAKNNGYFHKINRLGLWHGDSLTAALVAAKIGGGSATDTNVNFVAGDYSMVTGLTGDGSTKHLNTGLIPTASLSANDTHLAVYNRGSSAVGGSTHIGASYTLNLTAPYTDGNFYSTQYGSGLGEVSAAITGPYGLLIGSRISATNHAVYKNGSSLASNATEAGTPPSVAIFVFANNSAGTPATFTSHNLGCYSIGSGLTVANAASYYADLQAHMTDIGRQV